MEEIPVAIVGGGAVGLSIARELSTYFGPEQVWLFEKNKTFGAEQSGRSSEVLHSGINQEGLKARLCVEGNQLLRKFCRQHEISLLETGKLTIAVSKEEEQTLDELIVKAKGYNIPLRKLSGQKEISALELNIQAESAIYTPTTAVIDSSAYLETLKRLNADLKTYLRPEHKIINIFPEKEDFIVEVECQGRKERFRTRVLINSAGLYSDEIAKMVNPENKYQIVPVKGEYAMFRNRGNIAVSRNIYPVPWEFKENGRTFQDFGVHLTPLPGGSIVRVGPAVKPAQDKNDYMSERAPLFFYEKIKKFLPQIELGDLQLGHVGILAEEKSTHDFIIGPDHKYQNCLHLIGIESPGLTASLSIGKYVREIVKTNLGQAVK